MMNVHVGDGQRWQQAGRPGFWVKAWPGHGRPGPPGRPPSQSGNILGGGKGVGKDSIRLLNAVLVYISCSLNEPIVPPRLEAL
jgi:hypothetical protein